MKRELRKKQTWHGERHTRHGVALANEYIDPKARSRGKQKALWSWRPPKRIDHRINSSKRALKVRESFQLFNIISEFFNYFCHPNTKSLIFLDFLVSEIDKPRKSVQKAAWQVKKHHFFNALHTFECSLGIFQFSLSTGGQVCRKLGWIEKWCILLFSVTLIGLRGLQKCILNLRCLLEVTNVGGLWWETRDRQVDMYLLHWLLRARPLLFPSLITPPHPPTSYTYYWTEAPATASSNNSSHESSPLRRCVSNV